MRTHVKRAEPKGSQFHVLARGGAAAAAPSAVTVSPAPTAARFDPRTRLLLEAPIGTTLLKLAAPNVLVMFVQASVGLIETYFVGWLGTDALAGVALVFPLVMLMQMMSAGAVGGGISSAVARALGGGRRADADALALHALVIAGLFGLIFMLAVLGGGPWLYRTMGGSGASLSAALTYSNVVFSGAVLLWIFNSLANVIRGTGNMAVPALVTCAGVVVLVPLSPCLILGDPSRGSGSPGARWRWLLITRSAARLSRSISGRDARSCGSRFANSVSSGGCSATFFASAALPR